ncbi:2-amino-4-hydroxy-6-hydroxymethyldihydropteridine diphosphokinase [Pleurocapsa sp. PCC 7319]|uniref:2-amino-4-hydroxy-6- hydroxymethyldihydropteridine diphosphokinase n=1 Tax=Pleurocapsa sp. PCC 7319 TaxID=118161 RepID=UPI00034CD779|nr:2-amino-4-hydroxy-6-hydroxymethyldihydropteridine diphosphokinase [Pleurocapsa sp. PCC 7319]
MVECAIILGSNQGNSLDILQKSLTTLEQIPSITLKTISSCYQTKPVSAVEPQSDYLNG